ncbi:hypothetical protein V1477_009381 [Vespula maculifrons]|uniref:Uncharacterized protein n=1 Tax=Vespula maculifrons TaxID=7453 RepID=A0ABD2C9P9_VESMC
MHPLKLLMGGKFLHGMQIPINIGVKYSEIKNSIITKYKRSFSDRNISQIKAIWKKFAIIK